MPRGCLADRPGDLDGSDIARGVKPLSRRRERGWGEGAGPATKLPSSPEALTPRPLPPAGEGAQTPGPPAVGAITITWMTHSGRPVFGVSPWGLTCAPAAPERGLQSVGWIGSAYSSSAAAVGGCAALIHPTSWKAQSACKQRSSRLQAAPTSTAAHRRSGPHPGLVFTFAALRLCARQSLFEKR